MGALPSLEQFQHKSRMVFGNIIQVIGDTSSDSWVFVAFKVFKNGQNWFRILNELGYSCGPG